MDEPKEKQAEVPPEPTASFMTEMLKVLTAKVERESKFRTIYANNFQFEPSVWDLKILLGQLENHTGTWAVDWHTALTIPWFQVKFAAYYLRLQAAWHELQSGPLKVPEYVMPSEPKPPAEGADQNAIAFYEVQKKIYAEMFG